ncbi:MAG: biotin--[acetyl-CoA-carboxylase] ligase [Thermoplasmata archaeon]|nr:MAG: biotin--[acetyl-CoA-carboxylase] ligase [Thermoplasmata archaeon]
MDKLTMASLSHKNRLDMHEIASHLGTKIIGKTIHGFDFVLSTNDSARTFVEEGVDEGTVVFAEVQRAGKGRLNREWISPKGGLWISIILKPNIKPKEATIMTLLAGVAVAKTLLKVYNLNASIKWPNDVLIGNKKVCGILTELRTQKDKIDHLILGIGINVNFDMKEFPEDIRAFSTTLKHEIGKEVSLGKLLSELLVEMDECYDILNSGQPYRIINQWKELSITLGKKVTITNVKETIEGIALDIDDTGALIVDTNEFGKRKFLTGDCLHVSMGV